MKKPRVEKSHATVPLINKKGVKKNPAVSSVVVRTNGKGELLGIKSNLKWFFACEIRGQMLKIS
jgi:hypothetical protein